MLYPPVTPYRTGLLDVGQGHALYWETSGNPSGQPVVVLHGGPGGGCTSRGRRWFHPDLFQIVTYDQRGCGRSIPHGAIEHNTTADLVGDLELLRAMLGIERWVLLGFSWGTALALAYAETHPNRVEAMILSGVFTARPGELNGLHSVEAARAYQLVMTDEPTAAELAAARAWCLREDAIASTVPVPAPDDRTALARGRIGAHYFLNRYFLHEGQLLANAYRLSGIPGVIVQGRHDSVTRPTSACDLHHVWRDSRLELVDEASHSPCDPLLMRALMEAADSLLPAARARLARRAPRPIVPSRPRYASS